MEIKNQYGGYAIATTYDEFRVKDQYHRDAMAQNHGQAYADAHYAGVDARRAAVLEEYPRHQVVRAYYPEHDNLVRWCWQQFGPPQTDKCDEHNSDYPGCPLVLATKTIKEGKNPDGSTWREPAYIKPEDHGHEGCWKAIWLGKTGYDYGYMEYYFQEPSHWDAFVAVCEKLGPGERYDEE